MRRALGGGSFKRIMFMANLFLPELQGGWLAGRLSLTPAPKKPTSGRTAAPPRPPGSLHCQAPSAGVTAALGKKPFR